MTYDRSIRSATKPCRSRIDNTAICLHPVVSLFLVFCRARERTSANRFFLGPATILAKGRVLLPLTVTGTSWTPVPLFHRVFLPRNRPIIIMALRPSHILAVSIAGAIMRSAIIKRSITIAGHKTSLSLEDAFWECLQQIAKYRGQNVHQLVATINENRHSGNLSSAIRLFVLGFYRDQPDPQSGTRVRFAA